MKQSDEGKGQNSVLTIIIATYNAEAHIKDCLDSIDKHVTHPYELIIIDGKSQDSTLQIIERFNFLSYTLISEKDKGIYDALNKGIKYAKGKWLMFLGADDRILPTFKGIQPFLMDEQTIYYGNCRNQNHQLGGKFTSWKLAKMNVCHQAILYPRSVFEKYQYSLNYPVFADYLLNIQCWGDSQFKKKHLNIDLAYYNMEGFSSSAEDPDFKRDKPALVKKYLGYFIYIKYIFRKFKESKKTGSKFF